MIGIDPYKAKLLAENRIRWEFGFNDPTLAGWAATAGFWVAGVLALQAARRAPANSFDQRFWWVVCGLLLILGVNKQLDLHILLIDLGRAWAVDFGYYQQRRALQSAVMVAVVLAAVLVIGGIGMLARGRDSMVRLGLLGMAIILAYVVLRAAAFNHADSFLKAEIAGMRWNWTVEAVGLGLTALAAWCYRGR